MTKVYTYSAKPIELDSPVARYSAYEMAAQAVAMCNFEQTMRFVSFRTVVSPGAGRMNRIGALRPSAWVPWLPSRPEPTI
jgi:hypothetical protein